MVNIACAFTGHRPKKLPWRYDETDSRCVALKEKLTEQIARLAEAGVTDFFSGMACQRRFEIVRKRRRNFVIFRRRGVTKIRYCLAQKECSRFAVSGA